MKKWLLLFLTFPILGVCANELTEDYLDIAANYAVYGDYNNSLMYINKILEIEPSNIDAKELKSILLRTKNETSKSYLSSTNKNLEKAFNAKKIGKRTEVLSALSSNDYWSNYFLAEYYRDNNDLSNALIYYKKAADLKPNFSQTYLGLSKIYIEQKDYQNALNSLNKYISFNPNSDIAYALRAEVNMNLNNLSDAENDIKKAIDIEENISYLLTEAKIFYHQGKYEDAKIKLITLSRNIQTSEVYKYLGLCDYMEKDYPSALLNLDKAIILSDDDKNLNSIYNDVKNMLEK